MTTTNWTVYDVEPEECEECGNSEKMDRYQVTYQVTENTWAWICAECGHVYPCEDPHKETFGYQDAVREDAQDDPDR